MGGGHDAGWPRPWRHQPRWEADPVEELGRRVRHRQLALRDIEDEPTLTGDSRVDGSGSRWVVERVRLAELVFVLALVVLEASSRLPKGLVGQVLGWKLYSQ